MLCKSHTIACRAGHACSVQIGSACRRNFSTKLTSSSPEHHKVPLHNLRASRHETRTFDYEPGGQFLITLFWRSASYLLYFEKRTKASDCACGCTQCVRIFLGESAPQNSSTGIWCYFWYFFTTLDCGLCDSGELRTPHPPLAKGYRPYLMRGE